jgi:large subunit ribosomal protein L4e
MASVRPYVSVFSEKGEKKGTVKVPGVFQAPPRSDIVLMIHSLMSKNRRQPIGVSISAGTNPCAESWGTGRAVARIPRVAGGGTHRSGQGAYANSCRGGHMFNPTRTWRRWNRKVAIGPSRYAMCSAISATAIPALVMARGHRVENVPEIPLVVENIEAIKKTKEAMAVLTGLGAIAEVEKVKMSKKIRAGQGKMRNRRYVMRRGPLVVYNASEGLDRAFRNIPGVELVQVDRLNLLQLAPGGHLGRFVIWTKPAFERLDALYGSQTKKSTLKFNYQMPRPMMTNTDISRIINSNEVQVKLKPMVHQKGETIRKRNPLRNMKEMQKLNPAIKIQRKLMMMADGKARRAAQMKALRAKKE